jgi:predicted ribosomally synthesized peptide with SipW-like signal peptide
MKRASLSIFTIVAVAAITIGATMAVMVDEEEVAGNTFTAGQLDLELANHVSMPFSASNLVPGDSGSGKVTLNSLAGNVNGNLSVAFTNYTQNENACLEPEVSAGDPCGDGDLGLVFQLAIFLDVNQNGVYNQGDGDIELEYSGNTNTTPGLQPARTNDFAGDSWADVLTMVGGDSVDLVVQYNFPHNGYAKPDAIFMTDQLSFDLEMTLEQLP